MTSYNFTPSSIKGGSSGPYLGGQIEQGFNINFLITMVNAASVSAKSKLELLQARRSAISIADMFDMQMLMNHLAQLSEMSTSIVSAANTSIMSMARNVKG
jgi:hypothetical protein